MKSASLFIVMALVCGISAAGEPQTPEELFRQHTGGALMVCRLSSELAVLKLNRGDSLGLDDLKKCRDDATKTAAIGYKSVTTKRKKSPASVKILKEYYAQWLTTMGNLLPAKDEMTISFSQRKVAEDSRLDHLWNQFAIEAEL